MPLRFSTPRKNQNELNPARLRICGICVMAESIEQPAHFDIYSESVAARAFRVEQLANERFAAGHVIIGHDVHAADNLKPALGHKFAEISRLFRITFQEGPEIRHLIERE